MRISSLCYRPVVTGPLFLAILSLSACGSSPEPTQAPTETPTPTSATPPVTLVTAEQVSLGPVDAAMAEKGKIIYEKMCQACHRTDEDLKVGPGWQGITERRKPEWIINMAMHPEVYLESDPEVKKMEEKYLVPMPNQNISFEEARQLLEYMRQLDAQRQKK